MIDKQQWIQIAGWEQLQHYAYRDPTWIKQHTHWLSSDVYLDWSYAVRGLYHSLCLEYARSNGVLPADRSALSKRLGQSVRSELMEVLEDDGAIEYVDERPEGLREARNRSSSPGEDPVDDKRTTSSPQADRRKDAGTRAERASTTLAQRQSQKPKTKTKSKSKAPPPENIDAERRKRHEAAADRQIARGKLDPKDRDQWIEDREESPF